MPLERIPAPPPPRPNDSGYMEVWHKYLQADIRGFGLERERDSWKRAFITVAAILFAMMFALLVLVAVKYLPL